MGEIKGRVKETIDKFEKRTKWPKDNEQYRYKVAERDDYPQIYQLFEETVGEKRSAEHLQWKYWDNPSGNPFAVIAIDQQSNKVVAASTSMIKKAWVNGKLSTGLVMWDIAVHPDVRGGGKLFRDVTYGLQISTKTHQNTNWGFGGQSKPAVIKTGVRWFGYRIILALKTYELRLSLSPALTKRLGSLGKLLAKVADVSIRLPQLSEKFEMRTITRCGDEFDELLATQGELYLVSMYRDAATLNWRYFDNPIFKHQMLGAYRNDKLVGFVVWREYVDETVVVGTILDLWHAEDQQLAADLFSAASRSARSRNVCFMRMAVEEKTTSQKAIAGLKKTYVSDRIEDDYIITSMALGENQRIHSDSDYAEMETITDGRNWFYTQGDVDFRD